MCVPAHIKGTIRVLAGDWRLAVPRALTSKMWRQAGVSDAADVYCWRLFADSNDGDGESASHLQDASGSSTDNSGLPTSGNYCAPGYALVVASDGVWGTLAASDAARLVGQYWGKGGEASSISMNFAFFL